MIFCLALWLVTSALNNFCWFVLISERKLERNHKSQQKIL